MDLAYSYVRWSSAGQTLGDSLRRQIESAEAYCKQHQLRLSDLTFKDAGISAFKGKNVERGELGLFLKAIDEGKLKTPCYLIVESLDRLSRTPVNTALRLFQDITERGVTIITLSDGQRYSTGTINENWTKLC